MKAGRNFLNALLLTAAFFATDLRAAPPPKKVFKVGVVYRMSDHTMHELDTRLEATRGIKLAEKMFESRHPVKIELYSHSHGKDLSSVLEEGRAMARKGYPVVIGGEVSRHAIALSEVFEQSKTVFVSPTATNPQVTEGRKYTFITSFSDRDVARELALYTVKTLKPTVLGVLRNVSHPYPNYLSQTFQAEVQKLAPSLPVEEQKVLGNSANFEAQVKAFKERKVSHVALLSHREDLFQFVQEARRQNFHPVYLGSDGWGRSESIVEDLVLKEPEGRFVALKSDYWSGKPGTALAKEFFKASKKAWNREPNAYNAIGFDTAWLIFTAMNRVKDPSDAEQVREALLKMKGEPLVTSRKFEFRADHSPRKDLHIFRISKTGVKYEGGAE